MLTGPTNLQCPACGHVFMSVQSRPDSPETCAHCAFVGPRAHFRTLSQPLGAQPVRFQKRTPRLQPEPPPQQPQAVYSQTQLPYVPPAFQSTHAPQPAAPPPFSFPQSPPLAGPLHQPAGSLQPPAAAPVAHWPGLGATGTHDITPAAWQPPDQPAITPRKKSRLGFWLTFSALAIAVCGFTALLAREKIKQRINRLRSAQISPPATQPRNLPALATRVDPLEQMNQRVLTGMAMTDVERLIKTLFYSETTTERIKSIAQPEDYSAEVATMFADASSRPALVMITPITNPPLSLVTQERLPMFKVATTANKTGALVTVVAGENGAHLLSWPLFHETHDRLLSRYIEAKDRNPRWFHVGLRRYHSFELPESTRGEFDAIDIDGSTDGTGHIVTYVARESPLGRQFAKTIEWEKFYFGRVLVSWMDIAGELRPALLDYEGSLLPANKAPADQPAN